MRKLLAVSVGLLLFASACGGSSSKSSSSGSSNTSSTSGGSSFDQVYNKAKDATLRVTYQQLDDSGNPTDTFTVSQRGTNQIAYIKADSKTVVDGDKVTTCDNLQTAPSCQTAPGGPDVAKSALSALGGGVLAGISTAIVAAGGKLGDTSTDTVAGRSADCVTLTGASILGNVGGAIANALGGNAKAGYMACIDHDTGVLLKAVTVGKPDDKSGVVATEVGQPQDSDFATPTTTSTTTSGGGGGETPTTGSSGEPTGSGGATTGGRTCPPITIPGSPITYILPAGTPCRGG